MNKTIFESWFNTVNVNWKYNFLRVLRKIGLLSYLNLTLLVRLNGRKFRIPIFHGIGLDHFQPDEKWMIDMIHNLTAMKKGQFIDVGVNIGQTLLKLKGVNPDIKYVGFEPNPKCVYYLSHLISLNRFANTNLIPTGIYSFDGITQLFVNRNRSIDSGATIIEGFRDTKDSQAVVVPVISERSLSILKGDISVLKIDVEGAELEVVEQFKSIIQIKRPFVICEILPAYSEHNQFRIERQKRIESVFMTLNYKIAQIGPQLVRIESIPVNNDVKKCNYLFFPQEDGRILGLG